jgi:hypothetical protein
MEKSDVASSHSDEDTKMSETLNVSGISSESDETFDDADIKKAEEYKASGNEYFKCNILLDDSI